MGSTPLLHFFVSLLFLFVSSSHSSSDNINNASMKPAPPVNSQKVTLSLYYEALCPFSQEFIVDPLANATNSDLITIVDLELVPWGNAILLPNNTVLCQHGEDECYLNTIHACAINIWPDVIKHFNFIKCIVKPTSSAEETWKECADQLGMPDKPIKDCYESGQGTKLLLQFGNKTNSLKPPHEYVPWVVVNEVPLYEEFHKFVEYVCKAYTGTPKPKACGSYATTSTIPRGQSLHCPASLK